MRKAGVWLPPRVLRAVPTLLLAFAVGCDGASTGGDPLGPESEAASLEGVVTVSGTSEPVAGATVRVGNLSTSTDGSGSYRIQGLAPGAATVEVAAGGFEDYRASAELNPGRNSIPIGLEPLPVLVRGRVSDAGTDAPVDGATVRIGGRTSSTDSLGEYRLEGLLRGETDLVAWSENHDTVTTSVTLVGGENLLDFRMDRSSYAVFGEVRDAVTNGPIPGATVRLGDLAAESDSLGRYRIEGLLPAPDTLEVEAEGFDPLRVEVVLGRGENRVGALLGFTEARLEGRVRSQAAPDGLPATVRVQGQEARADREGRFSLGGLRVATWPMEIEVDDYFPKDTTVTLVGGVQDMVVDLDPQARLAVSVPQVGVISAEVGPVQAEVRLGDQTVETNSAGEAALDGFAPGVYRLEVELENHEPWSADVELAPFENTRTVDLTPRPPIVGGRVTDEAGAGVAGALVFLTNRASGASWALRTDGEGRYSDSPPFDPDSRIVRADGYDSDEAEVRYVPGGVYRDESVVLGPSGTRNGSIRGQVVRWPAAQRGEPMPGAVVVVSSAIGPDTVAVDGDGRFDFREVPAGRFRIDFDTEYGWDAVFVDVAPGQESAIQLEAVAPGVLAGRVRSPTGQSVQDAVVRLDGQVQRTDAQGRFSFIGLDLGNRQLRVEHPSYATYVTTVRIVRGEDFGAPLEIRLSLPAEPRAELQGRVESSEGFPVAGARVVAVGRSTTTNTLGEYSFTDLPLGSMTVSVSATDHQSTTRAVTLSAGRNSAYFILTHTGGIVRAP